jgi:hypothetical protein
VRPDAIVLWLTAQDLERLPASSRELAGHGVRIEPTEDIRSYKKIIPALRAWPDGFIVTADDDVYYHRRWLEELVAGWSAEAPAIVCRRARRIPLRPDGTPEPYVRWRWCYEEGLLSAAILPVGVGGVMFPPGSLAPEVLDQAQFLQLTPTADDLWLYWMARRAGARFRKVARQRTYFYWPRSQDVGLANTNRWAGRNDAQIAAMIQRFGFPPFDQ